MKDNKYTPFAAIRKQFDEYVPYCEQLKTTEWRDKRSKVLKKHNFQCQRCHEFGNQLAWELLNSMPGKLYVRLDENQEVIYSPHHVQLNVHHNYYIKDKLAWEYNDEALLSVCSKCHVDIHQMEDIKIYENEHLAKFHIANKCEKCGGTGYIDKYHYYFDGICFDCDGQGFLDNA